MERLQTRPKLSLGLIYCRCLRRSATARTAAYHVGNQWRRAFLLQNICLQVRTWTADLFTDALTLGNTVHSDRLMSVRLNGSERRIQSEHAKRQSSLTSTTYLLQPSHNNTLHFIYTEQTHQQPQTCESSNVRPWPWQPRPWPRCVMVSATALTWDFLQQLSTNFCRRRQTLVLY